MVSDGLLKHLACWLALTELNGFNHDTAIRLLQLYGSLEQALKTSPEALADSFPTLSKSIQAARLKEKIPSYEKAVLQATRAGISLITLLSEGYPRRLLTIPDPPLTLFAKGQTSNLDEIRTVAIVGTREPSEYGSEMSYRMARRLSAAGFVVVSGLAFGVDAQAHRGALDAGGKTVAVLPSYVGEIVPKGNMDIAIRILKSGGTLVSQYGPDSSPSREKFIARNRVIAALASATIIVEGTLKSGTRHQARYAQDLKRPLFVLSPIEADLPNAELPLRLKAEGAIAVDDEEDALQAVRRVYREGIVQERLDGATIDDT